MEKHLCEHGVHSSQQISDQEIWTLSSVLTLSVQWENCSPLGQVPILKRQLIWPLLSGTPDSFTTSFSVEHAGASAQNQSKGQPQSLRTVTYGNSKNLDMLFLKLSNFKPLNKHPKAALKPPHQMHPHMDYLQTWEALQLSRIEGLGFFKKKQTLKQNHRHSIEGRKPAFWVDVDQQRDPECSSWTTLLSYLHREMTSMKRHRRDKVRPKQGLAVGLA